MKRTSGHRRAFAIKFAQNLPEKGRESLLTGQPTPRARVRRPDVPTGFGAESAAHGRNKAPDEKLTF
jgi:hypothetical protein